MSQNLQTGQDTFLTPEEIAQDLAVSAETIRAWLRNGQLPGYKFLTTWRVVEADYVAWMAARYNGARRAEPKVDAV